MMNFECKMVGQSAEILLYGDIGDAFEGVTAKQFATDLKALGKVSEIAVLMNSPGGDVFDGVAIYNTLLRHPARVTVDIDGMALSAASLVAMAGDRVRMAENAMFMIHDPWGFAIGTAAEMRERANMLDKIKTTVRDTYSRRSQKDADEVHAMMAEETWMTAAEARSFGFIDEITGSKRVAAHVERDRFRRVPQRLVKPDTTVLDSYRRRIAEFSGEAN